VAGRNAKGGLRLATDSVRPSVGHVFFIPGKVKSATCRHVVPTCPLRPARTYRPRTYWPGNRSDVDVPSWFSIVTVAVISTRHRVRRTLQAGSSSINRQAAVFRWSPALTTVFTASIRISSEKQSSHCLVDGACGILRDEWVNRITDWYPLSLIQRVA